MTKPVWKPHVVVAAVIEQGGRFLLVEEETDGGPRFNQPAGHLEEGESLLDAVRREVFEETAYRFEPEALLGVYRWVNEDKRRTYLRFAFLGQVTGHEPGQALDVGILHALWMAPQEIAAVAARHRSPLVGRSIEDYFHGRRYPLEFLTELPDLA